MNHMNHISMPCHNKEADPRDLVRAVNGLRYRFCGSIPKWSAQQTNRVKMLGLTMSSKRHRGRILSVDNKIVHEGHNR
ncbi:hypothetical protein EAG_04625 [Camponotus floridanus]|uniref:Uncharacterized protein n=1 Tax=Camponotus floridanus TaxID=104421 RepID=E2A212_CAMFO|nr:hypothetical protein EAG_04625 [Camponotus floridanus]